MQKVILLLYAAIFSVVAVVANPVYRNQVFVPNIKTLQARVAGNELVDPVLMLGSEDKIEVGFDEMSHNPHFYSYRIVHCEADWTRSVGLNEIDYIKGFSDNKIEEVYQSLNTTVLYSHHSFELPNENVQFTMSGNYVAEIYVTDFPDSLVATVCFSVAEEVVSIDAEVSSKTEYGVNNRFQQLNFEVDYGSLNVADVRQQLNVKVRQNDRKDTEVTGILPVFTSGSRLVYKNCKELIFEGGSEYNRIDFSHIRNYSGDIEKIFFARPYYHVAVNEGKENVNNILPEKDHGLNGRYVIHGQDVWSDREIDYSIVHFSFPREEPWIDGSLYVCGYFNDNENNVFNKMVYNAERKQYELAVMLKNGGYSYQYMFVPAGTRKATSARTSGSFWQTENEYSIYVYYRAFGDGHDRLVGYLVISSGK